MNLLNDGSHPIRAVRAGNPLVPPIRTATKERSR